MRSDLRAGVSSIFVHEKMSKIEKFKREKGKNAKNGQKWPESVKF